MYTIIEHTRKQLKTFDKEVIFNIIYNMSKTRNDIKESLDEALAEDNIELYEEIKEEYGVTEMWEVDEERERIMRNAL